MTNNEIEGLTPQQEEVVLLKNLLLESLDKLINSCKKSSVVLDFLGLPDVRHDSRFKRIETLIDNLLEIDTGNIIDHPELTERYIEHSPYAQVINILIA
ncbi:hypothetical protein AVI51_02970 [Piscirickettsia salmonis]|uniref:Uncharacterized protein n=1 Tax=Piscirickettsia salmonis TaxID=1238 RepID=A0A9Q6Q0A3_PISSA|nr:hypothetical protein [Piscirickettsia salmonis]ALA25030.1 hypothetical protein KW89_1564 [Piscirickettsia salmonis]APS45316.1 hypothetical protein AVI48_13685 [Piscirickettsia salmonis]APS48676.1 hypothetical protein AVI49_14295 [Piscirickettsia salmonis]APS49921.1 hypothetical protein AVI50_03010 [Piscirickettsia salmonis]APS53112.1 hypothetical protein AVI51_02970 [Piscirickettsia salmonis]